MYCQHFGFKEPPFSIAPNPYYLFMSQQHRDALAHLLYGIESGGGFVLLTGEVGTGKTTVCRYLLEQVSANTNIALILNPCLGANELMHAICKELGIGNVNQNLSFQQLTECIYRFLLDNHAKGCNTVLIVDEAQHLQFKTLELIRLLTNLETNTKKLLQVIFIGQPELNTLLLQPRLWQLSQRITARFHILPMAPNETQAYIQHRLQVAGLRGNQEIFPIRVMKKIHAMTGGIPRLINVLCDRALLGAYANNKYKVNNAILKKSFVEIHGENVELVFKSNANKKWRSLGLVASVIIASAATLFLYRQSVWYWPPAAQVAKVSAKSSVVPTAINPPVITQPPMPEQNQWYINQTQAIKQLLNISFEIDVVGYTPCEEVKQLGYACENRSVKGWRDLKQINRPAVLQLYNSDNQIVYAPVIRTSGNTAEVLTATGRKSLSLIDLGEQWNGELVFIWQPPADFDTTVSFGDDHKIVNWLAKSFAILDSQPEPLSSGHFNAALKRRVILFQQQHNLEDDGVVGINTLLRLNEQLGLANTLQNNTDPKLLQTVLKN